MKDCTDLISGATNTVISTVTVGNGPMAVAVNSVTNQVYVANESGSNVTVIDGATNTMTTAVTVGNAPDAVAVNPVTNQVYVANQLSDNVTVINGATNTVTTAVTVGSFPGAVAVNPVTNRVYVANQLSNNVTVINGANNTVVGSPVSVGSSPVELAVNPVTNQVYVANNGGTTVTVIDGATNSPTSVPVGSGPATVAVNSVTNHVYVANHNGNSVSVIDGATNTVTATLPVAGSEPDTVAVNPVTNRVYVANENGKMVTVIDGTTNTVTATVMVGSLPLALAVNSVTNQIYVANDGDNTVTVIDGATNTVVGSPVPVGSGPIAVAVNPVTNQVYVANSNDNTVTVIDGATNTMLTTVTVGSDPQAVAVNSVTNQVYVVSDNTVTVIDGTTNTVVGSPVTAGSEPSAVAVNPVTNQVYVANEFSNNVTVIDVDGTGGQQTVPIAIATAAPASDPLTIAPANAMLGTPYITTNTSPMLTATVTSAYTASSIYVDDTSQTLENPPPTALYYQVDTVSGTWNQATAGATQAMFNIPIAGQTPGLHLVYLYAAYGDEGVPASSSIGSGNSPEISNVTAFPFVVVALPTTTTLTADTNPQAPNTAVTFTATVSSAGTAAPTGVVTFFDAISGTPVQLGTGNLSGVSGSDVATLQTNFTATGSHPITAVYGGDLDHIGSTGSLTENIASAPTVTGVSPTSGPAAGGTVVTITGTSFTGATSVSFGGAAASFTVNSAATSITVTSPAGTGTVDIVVTSPIGSSATSAADRFTYFQPLTLPSATLPAATAETPYSQTLTASGGTPFYTYAVTAGALPAGLTLSSAGVFSGTPTASGTSSFTVRVTDQNANQVPANFSLTVNAPAIAIAPAALPGATVGTAYSQTLTATGGTAPYTFTETGTLPPGITLSGAGALSGTPTAGGTFSFTVTAKDKDNFAGNQAYTVTVNASTLMLSPSSGTKLTATGEMPFSQAFTASGGTAPYSFTEIGALPSGITFSPATATLSGTAVQAGNYSIIIAAKDSSSGSGPSTVLGNYTLTVNAPTLTIAPVALPSPTVGTAYSQTLTVSGGTAPYTYAISAGALPAGITLSAGGVLAGTPTTSGSFSFTVTATDKDSFTGNQAYTLTVSAATVSAPTITISPMTLPAATAGTAYSATLMASGGTVAYRYSVTSGALPSGITLSASGVLAGTPAASGSFNFTVMATDSSAAPGPYSGTASYTLLVNTAAAPLGFTFTDTGASAFTAAPGAMATYNFALAPLSGSYPGAVSFSVMGLPAGATASFTPSTVAVGSGATPVVMTVQTASATAQNKSNSPFGRGIVLAFLLLPFVAKRSVREKLKGRMLLLVLLMAGVTATLTGCGSTNGFMLQSPQTYTLTVTVTSGTFAHSQAVTLIVQ